jgi:hypothetical protein
MTLRSGLTVSLDRIRALLDFPAMLGPAGWRT